MCEEKPTAPSRWAVSDGVLHHNSEVIELIPENSQKVAPAITEMRSALPKKSPEPSEPEPITLRRIQGVAGRCAESLTELAR